MTIRILNAQNKRCIEAFSLENLSLDGFIAWANKWDLSPKLINSIFKFHEENPSKNIDVELKGSIDWSPLGA